MSSSHQALGWNFTTISCHIVQAQIEQFVYLFLERWAAVSLEAHRQQTKLTEQYIGAFIEPRSTTTHPYRILTSVSIGFAATEDERQQCLVHVGNVARSSPSQRPNLLSLLGGSADGAMETLNGTLLVIWLLLTGIGRSPFADAMFNLEAHEPSVWAAKWWSIGLHLRKNLFCTSMKPPSLHLQPFLATALYTHCRASFPSLGVVQSFGTLRVCVPCCCLGSALRPESIAVCSSYSERIFCWFDINSFHCQSRTWQPSASLPSCNFFASSRSWSCSI